MALLTVYFCSSRKLKIVLKQKPFGKILGFSQFHFILLKQKPFGNYLKILRFPWKRWQKHKKFLHCNLKINPFYWGVWKTNSKKLLRQKCIGKIFVFFQKPWYFLQKKGLFYFVFKCLIFDPRAFFFHMMNFLEFFTKISL